MPRSSKKRFPFAVVTVTTEGNIGSVVRRNTTYQRATEYANGRITEAANAGRPAEFAVLIRPAKDRTTKRFGSIPTAPSMADSAATR